VRRVVVLLGLAASGCGASTPTPPAGDAKQTVMRYFAAFARADGAGMCREMTPRARELLASKTHVSCVAATFKDAHQYPEEIRRRMLLARYAPPKLDGGRARVDATGDDMFNEHPRHFAFRLEAKDGAWRIRTVGGDTSPDPVTLCAIGGLQSWGKGHMDPLWRKQGRAVFALYMSRFCKRMIAEHVMADPLGEDDPTPSEERKIDKLADRVLEEMVRDGSISTN
jgi:hypothetical protein